jgi:hypothetical protein
MIAKSLFFVAGTVVTLAVGYGALKVTAPSLANGLNTMAHDYLLGWDDAACSNNALGCLQNRFTTLAGLETNASGSIRQMRARLDQVRGMVEEQQTVSEKNAAFLDKGKTLLKEHELQPDQSIEFLGRTYPSLATFRGQLQLLFEEKSSIDTNLKSAQNLGKKLQEGLDALIIHQGRISLAKQMIPSQIELVKANQTLSDFNGSLAMINGVIKGSESGISESDQLIRSTKELMGTGVGAAAGLTKTGSASDAAFEAFLKQ